MTIIYKKEDIENTINRIKESDDFESFCGDCEKCALYGMSGTIINCEEVYDAYKRGALVDEDIAERSREKYMKQHAVMS